MFGSAVPWLLTEQVRPVQLWMNVGTGAMLPVGSTIVTLCARRGVGERPLVPDRQRHLERLTRRAGAVNVFVGSGPLPVPWVP